MIQRNARLLLASTFLIGSPALAQSVPSPSATADDIIVTAQKREQRLADVPISVQAFSNETLEKTGVRELSDLLRFVPGASEGISNSYGFRAYQIRGTGVVTGDSTVGYYLDDAAFFLIGSAVAPVARTFDVDRVEVLRGPQGTLYGLSSIGGTVRFLTAQPDLEDIRVRAQAGYSVTRGGDDNGFADGALSVPLIPGKLAVRATASYEKRGGYVEVVDFPGENNLDDTKIFNFRGRILAQPNDQLTISALYQRSHVKQIIGTLLIDNDPALAIQGTDAGKGQVVNTYDMVSGSITYDGGPITLTSNTGYIWWNLDQLAYINFGGPVEATQVDKSPTFSQEFRVNSNVGGTLDWVVGAFYRYAKRNARVTYTGGALDGLATDSFNVSRAYAVFGEASFNLMDGRLIPLVGLRQSWDDRKSLNNGFDQRASYSFLTPRFNLSWKAGENQLFYVNVARGERSGLFNNPATLPLIQQANIPAQEVVGGDRIWSYEAGAKGSFGGGMFGYDVAVYRFIWNDVQVTANVGAGLGAAINAGDAKSIGLDYGFNFTPLKGLTFSISGNINDTDLRNVPGPVAGATDIDGLFNGAPLPYVPKFTNTVGVSVDTPINDKLDFIAFASWSHNSGQWMPTERTRTDRLDIANVRAGFRRGPAKAELFVDNLLDEKGTIWEGFGLLNRNYPRVIGLQVAFEH